MHDINATHSVYSTRPHSLKLDYDPGYINAIKLFASILYTKIARTEFHIVKIKKESKDAENK
jgi:hypothetical protein